MINNQKSRALVWCDNSPCNRQFIVTYTNQNELQQQKAKLPMKVHDQTLYDEKGKVIRISRTRYCLDCYNSNLQKNNF